MPSHHDMYGRNWVEDPLGISAPATVKAPSSTLLTRTEFDAGLENLKGELRELTLAFQEIIAWLKKKEDAEAAAAYRMRKLHRAQEQAALLAQRSREYNEIDAQKQAEFDKSRSTAPAPKHPGRYWEQFEG